VALFIGLFYDITEHAVVFAAVVAVVFYQLYIRVVAFQNCIVGILAKKLAESNSL